ncbi:endonuclease [Sessilibacter sp. MAH1]
MKHRVLFGLLVAGLAPLASAQIENANFENFSGNTPTGWTTDTGIATSRSTIAQAGSSSVAVQVNTTSQASTDLTQLVPVVAGQTYNFSAYVRHTEGGMRARMVVDGFRNYSSPTLLNQWQQISYTYTAASTGSIEVGLRFYDVAGFDGSEIVYVDNFAPASTSGGGGGGSSSCADNPVTVSILTDNFGSETTWTLRRGTTTVASGGNYGNNAQISEDYCVTDGSYTFQINDSFGDGICCGFGNGNYSVSSSGTVVASGGQFASTESTTFSLPVSGGSGGGTTPPPSDNGAPSGYYASATGLSGFTLKSELHRIINNHAAQGYSAVWTFYLNNEIDRFYENDGSILDIYSERPTSGDAYNYSPGTDQCGTFSGEGNCYNREHSFPRSWFGGAVEPMNSDIHHIFATDGSVNGRRSSFPYGEVGSATFTSTNGSRLGSARTGLGYSGTVFEPIDEFKGDLARAYFYMATRYEDRIAGWQSNSTSADDVLNGTSTQAFEPWVVNMLRSWHLADPVSQKEIDRNNAAFIHQGNRNPFVDHPEYVTQIWGN